MRSFSEARGWEGDNKWALLGTINPRELRAGRTPPCDQDSEAMWETVLLLMRVLQRQVGKDPGVGVRDGDGVGGGVGGWDSGTKGSCLSIPCPWGQAASILLSQAEARWRSPYYRTNIIKTSPYWEGSIFLNLEHSYWKPVRVIY